MIFGLKGVVVGRGNGELWIEVNGVIYGVFVPTSLLNLSGEVILYTRLIYRDEQMTLFGFKTIGERELFDRLIKISGIGPKVALTIISTYSPAQFQKIVKTEDILALKKIPGVGPKTARRILMDIGELKFLNWDRNGIITKAIQALEGLGFGREEVQEVLMGIEINSLEEAIKEGLKRLSKR